MKNIRNYLFRILARREYSFYELRNKLCTKFPNKSDDIEIVLKEFQEKGWASDERFCETFIRSKVLTNKWGSRRLLMKLKEKGIEKDIALAKIEEIFPSDQQEEVLRELISKKREEIRKKGKTKNEYELRQKILAYLVGKGFDLDIVKKSIL
ncbi:recombination regulator RecX [Candidatus Gracilibacteria bacterium]|nr:recombination regulator RecX [Candidatus Gracilibacteria bacterium]